MLYQVGQSDLYVITRVMAQQVHATQIDVLFEMRPINSREVETKRLIFALKAGVSKPTSMDISVLRMVAGAVEGLIKYSPSEADVPLGSTSQACINPTYLRKFVKSLTDSQKSKTVHFEIV